MFLTFLIRFSDECFGLALVKLGVGDTNRAEKQIHLNMDLLVVCSSIRMDFFCGGDSNTYDGILHAASEYRPADAKSTPS